MTLVELILALAATGFIGLAIASMLAAVSYGTDSSRELRELTVKNKTLTSRISAAIRKSRLILDAGDGYVVLWASDSDGNGSPSLLELQRIELDPSLGEVTNYTPSNSAPDTLYQLTDDFDAITSALSGSSSFPGELWATGVASWTIELDQPTAQSANLLSFRLMLEADDLSDTMICAAALRN
jgi:type II secretory pathway pseudopilin PulG